MTFTEMPRDAIFIPGNTASSKNSKQWTGSKLIWSKVAMAYRENSSFFWMTHRTRFQKLAIGEKPIRIGLYFVRDSERKFDFVNIVQTVQDLMVRYGWVEDDNITEILPFPIMVDNRYYHVDKKAAGVYIVVL